MDTDSMRGPSRVDFDSAFGSETDGDVRFPTVGATNPSTNNVRSHSSLSRKRVAPRKIAVVNSATDRMRDVARLAFESMEVRWILGVVFEMCCLFVVRPCNEIMFWKILRCMKVIIEACFEELMS